MVKLKKCKACLEEKEVCEFNKCRKYYDGYNLKCRKCVKNKMPIVKTNTLILKEFKICSKCKIESKITNFKKKKKSKDGYNCSCKDCAKLYQKNNAESLKESRKLYYQSNKESKALANKKWREDNKEYVKQIKKDYYHKNKERNRHKSTNYVINRLDNDPIYKLIHNTRTLIRNSFKRGCKKLFNKRQKSEEILGCTIQDFIIHLQSLFTEEMTLENHGNCEECWQIDHKIPISSAKTEEEIIKLNHYTNLQPLWRGDNLTKGGKY